MRSSSIPPLLCFADDMIVFMCGFRKSIRGFLNFFERYELTSGQEINKPKSSFSVSEKCPLSRSRWISTTSGFTQGSLPFEYLGSVLYKGRRKRLYFQQLLIESPASCWAGKGVCCLSVEG